MELIRFSKKFWKSIVWATIIFIVCSMPSDGIPRFKLFQIEHFDKFVHFSLYLVFGVLLFLDSNTGNLTASLNRNKIIAIGSISIGYGITVELIQLLFTTTRSAEMLDVLANTIGVLTSLVAYNIVVRVLQLLNLKN